SIDVRIEVIRAFQRFGISKRYVGMLIRGIEDNEWKVRAETLTCILENRISSMYEYVERCLFDNRPEVRGLAVETINRLGINEAIPKLIDLMLDVTEDYKIVERVACMLSCCKDERVAKPFVELLVRGHFTDLCITGLKNIGKKSKDVILENLSRIEENRAGVLALLCKFGVKNCKEELLGMVGKDLEGVFRAVLKYGDKRLIEEVTEKISRDELDKCVDDLDNELYACLLSNSNDEIFLHALDNLRYINSIEAVRILLLCKYKKERKKKFEKELGYHLSKLLNDNLSDLKKSKHAKDIRKRARIVLDTIDL
ncbi:MAG: HEAT repeat domain-containing protein, partial [Thermoplasmata archaeon]